MSARAKTVVVVVGRGWRWYNEVSLMSHAEEFPLTSVRSQTCPVAERIAQPRHPKIWNTNRVTAIL